MKIDALETSALMNVAMRPDFVAAEGRGSWLTDHRGRRYLDFVQGWAVNALGHCPPQIAAALAAQAQRLVNPSPAFFNAPAIALAQRLAAAAQLERVFLCSSGAEANEGAIKLARRWGERQRAGAFEIITFADAFHGRTLATMSASGKAGWDRLFEPKVPGFPRAILNDIESVRAQFGAQTVGVMLEPVQGEAGVVPAAPDFLRALRQWCDEHGLLVILDEVQTGVGRTGTLFAFERAGVRPDILTLGKGLGGGVPLAALLARESVAAAFAHGDQGGTYCGNPLMAAVGCAVLDAVAQPDFLAQVQARLAAAPRRQLPSAWVVLLFGALADAGFPGTRPLDSAEWQAQVRWREVLTELGSLDGIVGPVVLADVVQRARRALSEAVFQPESPPVPVQVLGAFEAEHLPFDHLWFANLSDERWPLPANPSPWLATGLQRAWQVPLASADLALAAARRQLARLAAQCGEMVVSHAAQEADREVLPSALIESITCHAFESLATATAPLPLLLARDVAPAPLTDTQVRPLDADAAAAVRGGSLVFRDQSACAFRAQAVHRLHATPLAVPAPGLDAMTRGRLLHRLLQGFWEGLGTQAALLALGAAGAAQRLQRAAATALDELERERPGRIGPRLRALEMERLQRAGLAWLEIERSRPPFKVLGLEAQGRVVLGGLQVSVRPDRVDRLADGTLAVIDYKTGLVQVAAWLDARPDEPQLPLYATAYAQGALGGRPERVGALLFAQLRPGQTRAVALAHADGLLPGARVIAGAQVGIARPGWDGLLADWQEQLTRLAEEFVAGVAAVAPKDYPKTCRHCALPLACRAAERSTLAQRLAAADGAAEGVDGDDSEGGDD